MGDHSIENLLFNTNHPPYFVKYVLKAFKGLTKDNGTTQHTVKEICQWIKEHCKNIDVDVEPRVRKALKKMEESKAVSRKGKNKILWKLCEYECAKCKKHINRPNYYKNNRSSTEHRNDSRAKTSVISRCRSHRNSQPLCSRCKGTISKRQRGRTLENYPDSPSCNGDASTLPPRHSSRIASRLVNGRSTSAGKRVKTRAKLQSHKKVICQVDTGIKNSGMKSQLECDKEAKQNKNHVGCTNGRMSCGKRSNSRSNSCGDYSSSSSTSSSRHKENNLETVLNARMHLYKSPAAQRGVSPRKRPNLQLDNQNPTTSCSGIKSPRKKIIRSQEKKNLTSPGCSNSKTPQKIINKVLTSYHQHIGKRRPRCSCIKKSNGQKRHRSTSSGTECSDNSRNESSSSDLEERRMQEIIYSCCVNSNSDDESTINECNNSECNNNGEPNNGDENSGDGNNINENIGANNKSEGNCDDDNKCKDDNLDGGNNGASEDVNCDVNANEDQESEVNNVEDNHGDNNPQENICSEDCKSNRENDDCDEYVGSNDEENPGNDAYINEEHDSDDSDPGMCRIM